MADFSTNATQLSGPQGAGAGAIAPVQEQVVANPFMNALQGVTGLLEAGIKNNAKQEAMKLENAVVGGYVQRQKAINDGLLSGELNPSRAAAESRANFDKHFAGNSQYAKSLIEAKNALSGGGTLGEIEDADKIAKQQQKAREDLARTNGAIIYPWMNKQQKETAISGVESTQATLKAYELSLKVNAEARAVGVEGRAVSSEARTVEDKQRKDDSVRLINDLTGLHMKSLGSTVQGIAEQVRSGALTPEAASLQLQESFAGVNATLQSAAGVNPELATSYRSLFNGLQKAGEEAITGKLSADDTAQKLKLTLDKAKLVILADPETRNVVATSQLIGQNAEVALRIGGVITKTLARLGSQDITSQDYSPQVIGNPDVEKGSLEFTKKALDKLNNKGYADNPKAEKEAINTVNQFLKQAGDLAANPNVKPDYKKFTEMAKFLASPEYGTFAKSGKLSVEAATAAKYTFQSSYATVIQGAVAERLQSAVNTSWFGGAKDSKELGVSEVVDVQFSGAGITFVPRSIKGLSEDAVKGQNKSISDLTTSRDSINQLIRIGAHLEGSTDYAKYWEDNRQLYLPQIYVGAGVTYKGRTSKGGRIDDPKTWVKDSE